MRRLPKNAALAVAVLVLLAGAPAAAGAAEEAQCTPDALFDDARAGLAKGSPALKRYLKALLADAALVMPNELLLKELEREDDPAMIEALGAAIAAKAEAVEDPKLVAGLLKRAVQDEDPARRAAAVRALRGTGSVELMQAAGVDVDYARLVRDEAPEVRAAVVDNLVVEDDDVYSGHDGAFAEEALRVAEAAEDPAVAARLIAETSTEAIGPDAARGLSRTLDADAPALRSAAARALGGVSPPQAEDALASLVARYRAEPDVEVRRAILASIARLGRARAIPVLESLRPVDPRLSSEIDAWIAVLQRGLPEWSLILREKARL